SQRVITPVRPMASSKPVLDESNNDATTACNTSGFPPKIACHAATKKAMRKSAAQIQLSTDRRMRVACEQRQGRFVVHPGRTSLAHRPPYLVANRLAARAAVAT